MSAETAMLVSVMLGVMALGLIYVELSTLNRTLRDIDITGRQFINAFDEVVEKIRNCNGVKR